MTDSKSLIHCNLIVLDVNIPVQWLENRSKAFEPAYLYTMEKVWL